VVLGTIESAEGRAGGLHFRLPIHRGQFLSPGTVLIASKLRFVKFAEHVRQVPEKNEIPRNFKA
jgi:hypothetical protein